MKLNTATKSKGIKKKWDRKVFMEVEKKKWLIDFNGMLSSLELLFA